jgi:hypothetical protein
MISRVLQKGSTWLINSSLVTITSGANPVCRSGRRRLG